MFILVEVFHLINTNRNVADNNPKHIARVVKRYLEDQKLDVTK